VQQFLYGHACGDNAAGIVRSCLNQIGTIPKEASLGFIYATDRLASELPLVYESLRQAAPQVHWVGSTGMGIASTAHEYYDERALVVMLTDIPAEQFRLIANTEEMFPQLAPNLARWCSAEGCNAGILHAEPTYVATSYFMNNITEHALAGRMNGGLSSADGAALQIADGVHDDGVSGVLFSSALETITGHTQGCSPIGSVHDIDSADQNLVLELDGRPALEVLKEDVGEILSRDLSKLGGYIYVGLPINDSSHGDYQVRALMGLDMERQLLSIGDYMEGRSKLLFCRRDGNTAREDMQRMLQQLKEQLNGRTIRGGVYISCINRGRNLFGDDSAELYLISEMLGEFPLAGFFAYGEICSNRLYSQTGVLTLFL
jgi:small ligand-binding sensory domain FIST